MPKLAQKCIDSWKKYLPDYRIKLWNEDNFDMSLYPYAAEAYQQRKFAFVSDVARLYALYTEGGIYMDTDLEVIKPLDKFLVHTAFSGFEDGKNVSAGIIGTEKGSLWAKENLDSYLNRHFLKEDGTPDYTTIVNSITAYMVSRGLVRNNTFQDFPGLITIYPSDYFYPISLNTMKMKKTVNTATIHYFMGSWGPRTPVSVARKWIMRLFGEQFYQKLRSLKLKIFPKPWK